MPYFALPYLCGVVADHADDKLMWSTLYSLVGFTDNYELPNGTSVNFASLQLHKRVALWIQPQNTNMGIRHVVGNFNSNHTISGYVADVAEVNDARGTRVADLLSDFRSLQHSIASVSCDPPHPDDFYTEGYAALRQCSVDGQHVLNVAADTRVPTGRGGQAEQEKAELTQVLLDSFSRRHEAQKICMRQSAAMRWVALRDGVLMGMRPDPSHVPALVSCDQALRAVRYPFLLLRAVPLFSFSLAHFEAETLRLTREHHADGGDAGTRNGYRREHLQFNAQLRLHHGPLDGRRPILKKRAALAPESTLRTCTETFISLHDRNALTA
ncbi:hypothetical protein V492_03003 [Pseudogymnoascus sp. VKM F-4246]|nr:hypothetical protein V492_03003 [Pseudogymnoascus sp. VKM F-4246]